MTVLSPPPTRDRFLISYCDKGDGVVPHCGQTNHNGNGTVEPPFPTFFLKGPATSGAKSKSAGPLVSSGASGARRRITEPLRELERLG